MSNEDRINNSSNGVSSSLRQYRFQKSKNVIQHNNKSENQHAAELKLVPGKRRIHTLDDSNSSNESCTPTKNLKKMGTGTIDSANISMIRDREARLIAVKQKAPMYDTMVCQDALVTCNWNIEESIKYLQENCGFKKRFNNTKTEWSPKAIPAHPESPNSIRTSVTTTALSNSHITTSSTSSMNGTYIGSSVSSSSTPATHQKTVDLTFQNGQHFSKLKKTKEYVEQRSDDSGDDQEKPTERVFDSDDDSDTEYSTFMTKDRKNVFDFINNGSVNELICVKTCSTKKIECIMELRPFRDWADLVKKLQNHKFVSSDLLNACQEYLARRNNVATVMKKCNRIVQRLESVVGDSRNIVTQPSILNSNCKLADYQMVGLNWLALMNQEEMNGILADEMGLGKTIQVIAFLAYLKEKQKSKATHLIIVPSSTLDNWELELSKWCPTLRVEKYYGSATDRKVLRISWARAGGLRDVDVILTTYHMVSSSPEERKMFRIIKLHYVIFDEAHMLKNMTTQRYAQLIRINSDRRLLLTGTPLQNSLLELMSLLCFVMPSLFANKAEDIKSLFQKNKLMNSDEIGLFEQTQIDQAKRIMKPFVLRRLKKDVLNALPKKIEITKKIPLPEYQKEKYMDLVECYSSEKGVVKATVEISGMSIMMDMRKLANHPLLQRYYYSDECVLQVAKRLAKHPEYKKTPNPNYIFEELAILSDFQLFQTMERYDIIDMPIPDELILNSGKINELDQLLPQLKLNGHRVLIFSQFTMMLDILERYLDIREYGFLRLDGSTPVTERQELIDKYMTDSDIFVFLLSTKAGGLGINLTAADTVIIHDIDFNPYNDKQAEDRCHRMGQTRPVTIYRFIAEGTIEEGMSMVALEKLNLEKEITNDDISNENGELQEQKCMVRLLTTALGIDKNRVETMLTPIKKV